MLNYLMSQYNHDLSAESRRCQHHHHRHQHLKLPLYTAVLNRDILDQLSLFKSKSDTDVLEILSNHTKSLCAEMTFIIFLKIQKFDNWFEGN